MANKPGTQLHKLHRDRELIISYNRGADAESLAQRYHLTERQVYRIVSYEHRMQVAQWCSELGEDLSTLHRALNVIP